MSQVNLSISNDVIKSIVESKIKSEVTTALASNSEKIIEKLVSNILTTKVNKNGEATSSSYEQVGNMLDWVIQNEVKQIVIASVREWGQKSKELIAKQIDSTLKKEGKKFASKLTESVVKQMSNDYNFKFFFEGSAEENNIYDRLKNLEYKLK